ILLRSDTPRSGVVLGPIASGEQQLVRMTRITLIGFRQGERKYSNRRFRQSEFMPSPVTVRGKMPTTPPSTALPADSQTAVERIRRVGTVWGVLVPFGFTPFT